MVHLLNLSEILFWISGSFTKIQLIRIWCFYWQKPGHNFFHIRVHFVVLLRPDNVLLLNMATTTGQWMTNQKYFRTKTVLYFDNTFLTNVISKHSFAFRVPPSWYLKCWRLKHASVAMHTEQIIESDRSSLCCQLRMKSSINSFILHREAPSLASQKLPSSSHQNDDCYSYSNVFCLISYFIGYCNSYLFYCSL